MLYLLSLRISEALLKWQIQLLRTQLKEARTSWRHSRGEEEDRANLEVIELARRKDELTYQLHGVRAALPRH